SESAACAGGGNDEPADVGAGIGLDDAGPVHRIHIVELIELYEEEVVRRIFIGVGDEYPNAQVRKGRVGKGVVDLKVGGEPFALQRGFLRDLDFDDGADRVDGSDRCGRK